MSHTPGPWTVSEKSDPNGWSILAEITEIATVHGSVAMPGKKARRDGEEEANARLIAAAPELLDACKRAYEMLHDEDYDDDGTGFLRAVIEKAQG